MKKIEKKLEINAVKNSKIALIDSDSILYICLYNKKDDIPKTLDQCKSGIDNMISNILKYTKSTHYILTLTVGTNFRYTIRDNYKADRKKSNKPDFFKECREYLIERYNAIWNENLESDDLVNIYSKVILDSFIAACDSDILEGLEGKHFNYKAFKWVNTTKEEAIYKFWHDMIAGTHNGIKGLPGKGTKFVQQLFVGIEESDYRIEVLSEYIKHFGESEGIENFYKNYKCLKIIDKYEGLEIIEPVEFKVGDELPQENK